jgi:hypothetical protein
MPWEIRETNGKYCVHRKTDDKKEACHATMEEAKEHMTALYASSDTGIEKATNVRAVLESRIHESFTVAADQLFGRGVIDRPTRIQLSSLIGDLLDGFGSAVGMVLEQTAVSDGVANEIMQREVAPPAIFKGKDGLWNWIGVPSNNILDDGHPQHILSAKAHRFMVSAIDSGFYNLIYGTPAPPLWQWHLPFAIGETKMMAYDERGFMIAAGVQKQGHVYDLAFEAWSKVTEPVGMSHGVPAGHYGVDEVDRRIINYYLSEELTICPVKWSANLRTMWMAHANSSIQKEMV